MAYGFLYTIPGFKFAIPGFKFAIPQFKFATNSLFLDSNSLQIRYSWIQIRFASVCFASSRYPSPCLCSSPPSVPRPAPPPCSTPCSCILSWLSCRITGSYLSSTSSIQSQNVWWASWTQLRQNTRWFWSAWSGEGPSYVFLCRCIRCNAEW